jgi:hypothetical protein
MIAFTISRTIDFLKRTLPPEQGYIAYLAVAAFDIGVLAWLYFAMNGAEGQQRVVAYGMVFICAGGVIVSTVCDLFIISSANGLAIKPDMQMGTIALWIVCAVIALNFLAGILVHLFEPGHIRHHAVENAKGIIFRKSLEAINVRAAEIAPQIAASSADYWERVVTQELIESLPKGKEGTIVELTMEPVALAQTIRQPSVAAKVAALEKKKPVRKRVASTTQKE